MVTQAIYRATRDAAQNCRAQSRKRPSRHDVRGIPTHKPSSTTAAFHLVFCRLSHSFSFPLSLLFIARKRDAADRPLIDAVMSTYTLSHTSFFLSYFPSHIYMPLNYDLQKARSQKLGCIK